MLARAQARARLPRKVERLVTRRVNMNTLPLCGGQARRCAMRRVLVGIQNDMESVQRRLMHTL